MSDVLTTNGGAFTAKDIAAINEAFADLSASTAGGTLTSAHLLVGNSSNVATDTAVSGDASLSNAGAVTVTGVNGVAVTADGGEIDDTVTLIAAIPTVDPEDGSTIWNDSGVLKVASAP